MARDAARQVSGAWPARLFLQGADAARPLEANGCRERLRTLRPGCELAVPPAIADVDHQPKQQPYDEAEPGIDLKARHQQEAKDHAQHGEQDAERRAEAARPVGLLVALD